jgi:hypothetical protein
MLPAQDEPDRQFMGEVARGGDRELDPSGPNSVPGALPSACSRFHAARCSSTDELLPKGGPNSRRSTSEHPLPQDGRLRNRWPDANDRSLDAECSLERR